MSTKSTKFTNGSLRAARALLAEVHFGGERTGPTSASDPHNAAFLDRRAAELAHLVSRETGDQELLDVLKRVVQRYEELLDRDATHHEFYCVIADAEAALKKAEGER